VNNDKLLAGLRKLEGEMDAQSHGLSQATRHWLAKLRSVLASAEQSAEGEAQAPSPDSSRAEVMRSIDADLREQKDKRLDTLISDLEDAARDQANFSVNGGFSELLRASVGELSTLRTQMADQLDELFRWREWAVALLTDRGEKPETSDEWCNQEARDTIRNLIEDLQRKLTETFDDSVVSGGAHLERIKELESQVSWGKQELAVEAEVAEQHAVDAGRLVAQVATLEAKLVESEQALSVANASWTEAVRQRDTRIAELESQLEELHEWTSSDERERLVLDLQRCHESLDKAMRERDSYMCTADSAEQKHTELLSEHVKATGDLGRALLEIGRLEAQMAECVPVWKFAPDAVGMYAVITHTGLERELYSWHDGAWWIGVAGNLKAPWEVLQCSGPIRVPAAEGKP